MTTICSFECNKSLFETLTGDSMTFTPIDGRWVEADANQFEESARNLAYGLMVKDFRRDETVMFTHITECMKPLIATSCKLAHLNVKYAQDLTEDSFAAQSSHTLSSAQIEYLINIGRTWARKYKPSVDRTLAKLMTYLP